MYLNIHPLIVHFPIALLMTGFLFELIGLFAKKDGFGKFAFILYILGTVGAAAAVISGNFAEDGVGDILGIEHALEEHEQLGTITLWFFVAMTLIRAVLFFKRQILGYSELHFCGLHAGRDVPLMGNRRARPEFSSIATERVFNTSI